MPSCGSWITIAGASGDLATTAATSLISGASTTTVRAGRSSCALASTCSISVRPASGWSTLGSALRIRVPLPAARTVTHKGAAMLVSSPGASSDRLRRRRTLAISLLPLNPEPHRLPEHPAPSSSTSTAPWSRPRPTFMPCWRRCWPRRAHGADAAGRTRHDRRRGEGADRAGASGHGATMPTWTRCTAASPSVMPRSPAGTARPSTEPSSCWRRCAGTAGASACAPTSRTRRPWACSMRWGCGNASTRSSAATACPASASPTRATSRPCWPSWRHRPQPPSWSATAATTCAPPRRSACPASW